MRWQPVFKWVGIALGSVVLIVVLILVFIDWNVLKRTIEEWRLLKAGAWHER